MTYLSEVGFSEEIIRLIESNLPSKALLEINKKENVVLTNIKYLKDLGVTNYIEAFIKFYNMFLLDNNTFDEIFSKYDKDDLVAKLEKNVAIMEYL